MARLEYPAELFGSADTRGCLDKQCDPTYRQHRGEFFCKFYQAQVGNEPVCSIALLGWLSAQVEGGQLHATDKILDPLQFYPMSTSILKFAREVATDSSESKLGPDDVYLCRQEFTTEQANQLIADYLAKINRPS